MKEIQRTRRKRKEKRILLLDRSKGQQVKKQKDANIDEGKEKEEKELPVSCEEALYNTEF